MGAELTVAANRSVWIELRHLLAEGERKKHAKEEEQCEPRNSRGR